MNPEASSSRTLLPPPTERDRLARGLSGWLLPAIVLAYVALGWFPWVPVEGDDIAIAAGAFRLSLDGDLDHGFDYRYDTQAATYLLVAALDRALGVPPMAGFALWTLAGFAAFFGFGAWLIARETQLPAPLAALVLLLFQESYVSAYYANSSMIAAGFLFAAVFAASKRRENNSGTVPIFPQGKWDCPPPKPGSYSSDAPKKPIRSVVAAGSLFALAALARFDAILMAPALLVVLWPKKVSGTFCLKGPAGASHKRFLTPFSPWKWMLLFAVVSAGVFLLLAYASGVSIARIWEEIAGHARRFVSLKRTLMNYLTLVSGVGFLLWFVGLQRAVKERRRRLLLMSFAGWIPLVATYGLTVTTPKYLLYGLPFFALLVAYGLKAILEPTAVGGSPAVRGSLDPAHAGEVGRPAPSTPAVRGSPDPAHAGEVGRPAPSTPAPSAAAYRLRWICLILFAAQYILGPLTVTSWALGKNVVVVGTHDGLRRLDAVGYVPLMWLRTKLHYHQGLAEAERILETTCDAADNGLALTGDWFSSKWVSYQLLRAGYRCVESARNFDQIPIATERDFHVYVKGEKKMTTFQIEWVAMGGASRDWRSRVRFDSFDSILLFSRLEDPGELLGHRVSCEPLSKISGFDRLPVFRIHPLPADSAGAAQPEQKR